MDYCYALTYDKDQGSTVDHALYHPTDRATSERAYVALSRGRHSNRVYAVKDAGWQEALTNTKAHTIATDQQPSPIVEVHDGVLRERNHERRDRDRGVEQTRAQSGRSIAR